MFGRGFQANEIGCCGAVFVLAQGVSHGSSPLNTGHGSRGSGRLREQRCVPPPRLRQSLDYDHSRLLHPVSLSIDEYNEIFRVWLSR